PAPRKTALRSEQFEQNINRRGKASQGKKKDKYPVGPWVLGLFLFVVVGSAVFQIIAAAQRGGFF
ncbi:stress associated endoplasmic reticulum protein, putative, partial [Perkinsus marinus ATCC 50983]